MRGEAREKIFFSMYLPSLAAVRRVAEEGEVVSSGDNWRGGGADLEPRTPICGVGVPWFPVRNGFVRSVRAARGDRPGGDEWTVRRGDLCLILPACPFFQRCGRQT